MSDAPETIWAYSYTGRDGIEGQWRRVNMSQAYGTMAEYRRADLPATDAQAMANPKVQALVEALRQFYSAGSDNGKWTGAKWIDAEELTEAWLEARAALAALETDMRCAECDCKNGGADCNWIDKP